MIDAWLNDSGKSAMNSFLGAPEPYRMFLIPHVSESEVVTCFSGRIYIYTREVKHADVSASAASAISVAKTTQ